MFKNKKILMGILLLIVCVGLIVYCEIKVDKYFLSSKRCSKCGNVLEELELSVRTYACKCGNVMDRDTNAAINIAHKGFMTLHDVKI